jgi:hypothetical protein
VKNVSYEGYQHIKVLIDSGLSKMQKIFWFILKLESKIDHRHRIVIQLHRAVFADVVVETADTYRQRPRMTRFAQPVTYPDVCALETCGSFV